MLQYSVRHFWYVFRWVTGKQYAEVCHVCHRGAKMDARLVESRLAKSPIPFGARWSWAFLVALLAIALVFDVMDTSSRNTSREAYLAAPMAGDRYVVNVASLLKTPQSQTVYGVLRVRGVKGGSVEFDAPTFFYPRASGPEKDMREGKLDRPGYFSPTPVWRWVFGALAVVAVVAMALVMRMPETKPAPARNAGGMRIALSGYRELLSDPGFLRTGWMASFALGSFFVYVSHSSFVMSSHFGVQPGTYSVLFALNAVGLVVVSQANGWLGRRSSPRRSARSGSR